MPAGARHVLTFLFPRSNPRTISLAISAIDGQSGLFEAWRVIQAGAVAWFYEGTGGSFDYGPKAQMALCSANSRFGNVALTADNDRMYHRIGG